VAQKIYEKNYLCMHTKTTIAQEDDFSGSDNDFLGFYDE
jgi:hypothetical protein